MSYINITEAFNLITDFADQATTKSEYAAYWKAARALNTLPTIEICRCKDCYFWKERWHDGIIGQVWGECHQFRDERENYNETEAYDFCSYAERKETDE